MSRCRSLNSTFVTLSSEDCSGSKSISISILEEAPNGASLMEFTATDPEGDTVVMRLTGNAQAVLLFNLESDAATRKAVLKTSSRLDAETFAQVFTSLTIEMEDGSSNRIGKTFSPVVIQDANDNIPEFLNQPYRWDIPENTMSASISFAVNVADKDRDSGSMSIEFKEVSGSDATGIFSFSPLTSAVRCAGCKGRLFSRSISLLRPLDFETSRFFQISVNATDLATGGVSSFTDVIINVADLQDTLPFFEGLPYLASVRENSPAGSKVVTVVAKDGDRGRPNAIRYSLRPGAFTKYFLLNSTSGGLTLSSTPLDRESSDILSALGAVQLTAVATEVSANASEATAAIGVTVLDANDFQPQFAHRVYNASVVENTRPGVPITFSGVASVSVKDLDAGSNGAFNLSVVGGDFAVAPVTVNREAAVTVTVVNASLLDYEARSSLTFEIVATETATAEKFSSTATVILQIIDSNDNMPVFNQSKYLFSVPENAPVDTYVGTVQATDRDSEAYGAVTYSLVGTDAWKFAINASTGRIEVSVEADKNDTLLDREKFPTIYLTLQAADGGGFITAVQLQVELTDVNDQTPKFTRSSYSGVVRENSLTFETPVQVEATDADQPGSSNSAFRFSLAAGDTDGNFLIDASSGLLTLRRALDFENLTSSLLNLTVVAVDAGGSSSALTGTAVVKVTVLDQNDNSPQCQQPLYEGNVIENATSETPVLKIVGSDADAPGSDNSRLFFRIQSGAADKFGINGDTGQIFVERGANLDVTRYGSSYNLSITIFDRGSPQRNGTCVVRVSVKDVNNQKPYFPTPSRRETVSEGLPVGAALPSDYAAVDPDASARLSYSLLLGQMAASDAAGRPVSVSVYNFTRLFSVDPNNGSVFVSAPLDRERAEELVLPIFVRDLAAETTVPAQTATGTLIVTLSDVNDEAPVFLPPAVNGTYAVTVSESQSAPADISLKALASDADKTGGALSYSVEPPDAFFAIDASTAQVSLKASLDRERQSRHEFRVTANDSVHVTTATVVVTVADANDMEPVFVSFANVTVAEDAAVGSLLTTVVANDSDLGEFGRVNYRIVSGGQSKFAINASTGAVTLVAPLDRDVPGGGVYRVVVEAFDNPGSGDSKRTSRTLSVTVTDVNDSPPKFSEANFTIASLNEKTESGKLVKEITATDADAGANQRLTYSLAAAAGHSDRALQLFSVATRTVGSSFVADISTRQSLKNAVGWYYANLVAADAGTPSLSATAGVSFFIADVNDYSPQFVFPNVSETVLSVNESTNTSSTVGVELLRAIATDSDFGNNSVVRYRLASSTGDHAAFSVDSVTGVVKVVASFDRETKAEYRFQIVAHDLGEPQLSSGANVVVNVVDIDESPPVFDAANRQQSLSIAENLAPASVVPGLAGDVKGVLIGSVAKATDPDAGGATAAVCYFVINRMFDKFYLNKNTGALYALASFNRETDSQFTLYIVAVSESHCSSGAYEWQGAPKAARRRRSLDTTPVAYDPSNAAMSKIVITVADVNDNPPVWSQTQFYGGVNVNDPPNTEVFNFANSVADADAGNNSQLVFSMTQPQPDSQELRTQLQQLGILDSVLQLGAASGLLRTGPRTYFQTAMSGSLTLTVSASDGKFSASAACTIYLLSLQRQIVVTIGEHTSNVTRMRDTLANYLTNITGWRVVVNNIVTHRKADGTADSGKTDVYVHAIRTADNSIVPAATLRDRIDLLWTNIRVLYKEYGVLSVKLAAESTAGDSSLQLMQIALIVVACGLTILLFAACVSLWSCRKMYRRKLKAATAVAFGPSAHGTDTVRLPGTNLHAFEGSNPIWNESTYDLQRSNQAFGSDKDSIDDNVIDPQLVRPNFAGQYDEVEKSLNFFENDEIGSQEFMKDSREMLSNAVEAGPDVIRQAAAEPVTAANLQSLQTSNI